MTTANRSRRSSRSENAIDNENSSKPAPDKGKPKDARKAGKNAKPAKKEDRANKTAEVIALMKRAKSATLHEIMRATSWLPHTVRSFVSILGKGGEKIESSKNAAGERRYKIGK